MASLYWQKDDVHDGWQPGSRHKKTTNQPQMFHPEGSFMLSRRTAYDGEPLEFPVEVRDEALARVQCAGPSNPRAFGDWSPMRRTSIFTLLSSHGFTAVNIQPEDGSYPGVCRSWWLIVAITSILITSPSTGFACGSSRLPQIHPALVKRFYSVFHRIATSETAGGPGMEAS